jgi:hypothetical protein
MSRVLSFMSGVRLEFWSLGKRRELASISPANPSLTAAEIACVNGWG